MGVFEVVMLYWVLPSLIVFLIHCEVARRLKDPIDGWDWFTWLMAMIMIVCWPLSSLFFISNFFPYLLTPITFKGRDDV